MRLTSSVPLLLLLSTLATCAAQQPTSFDETETQSAGGNANALASEEELYLDRKQAYANPKKDRPGFP